MQAVHDKWHDNPNSLDEAVLYNRRLWTVFIDSVLRTTARSRLQFARTWQTWASSSWAKPSP